MSRFKGRPMDGLPGRLPQGEAVLWQGKPNALALARRVLRTRVLMGYFAVLIAWHLSAALGTQSLGAALRGCAGGLGLGAAALALFYGFAFLVARSTTYTITARRVVITFGMALPKSLNIPFSKLSAADVTLRGESGDIVLTTEGKRMSYVLLWPHVTAGRAGTVQPTLRCIADAPAAASILGRAVSPSVAEPMEAMLSAAA
jgi:hypothetical protein